MILRDQAGTARSEAKMRSSVASFLDQASNTVGSSAKRQIYSYSVNFVS